MSDLAEHIKVLKEILKYSNGKNSITKESVQWFVEEKLKEAEQKINSALDEQAKEHKE